MEFEKSNKKKIILIVLAVIIIIGICLGIYYAIRGNKVEIVGNPDKEIISAEQAGINLQEEIKALNLKYADAKAWIRIPGTTIDYPVFQAANNDRYLRLNRDNVNTGWGEHFLDYRSNINNMTDKSHFIIYGHNTEKDTHFTPIMNYRDKSFFETHKIIEMSTLNGNYKWEIFSVYRTDANFFYIDTKFNNSNEYTTFLNTIKSKSMYNTNVSVSGNDTILTLSTCDYSLKDGRFVVHAKLVK